jgi:hypothetical protein
MSAAVHGLALFPSAAAFRVDLGTVGNTYEPLRKVVGGWLEWVKPMPGADAAAFDVWAVDDYHGQTINLVASYMVGRQLVGPVVLTRSNGSGDTTGLTSADFARFERLGLELVNNGAPMTAADVLAWVAEDGGPE